MVFAENLALVAACLTRTRAEKCRMSAEIAPLSLRQVTTSGVFPANSLALFECTNALWIPLHRLEVWWTGGLATFDLRPHTY